MENAPLIKLNRFTSIAHFEDLLTRKKLALVNPELWEDSNDKATIEIFKKASSSASVYALCLTHENETIHHWNAFAHGKTGCCIEISPAKLIAHLDKIDGLSYRKVRYLRLSDLSKAKVDTGDLPFVKREPYKNENEYRLFVASALPQQKLFDVAVELDFVRRVTINNKVAPEEFDEIKRRLLSIKPDLKVYQSTIYNNSKWINHFEKKFNASHDT